MLGRKGSLERNSGSSSRRKKCVNSRRVCVLRPATEWGPWWGVWVSLEDVFCNDSCVEVISDVDVCMPWFLSSQESQSVSQSVSQCHGEGFSFPFLFAFLLDGGGSRRQGVLGVLGSLVVCGEAFDGAVVRLEASRYAFQADGRRRHGFARGHAPIEIWRCSVWIYPAERGSSVRQKQQSSGSLFEGVLGRSLLVAGGSSRRA